MTDHPRPRVLMLTWAGVPRAWLDALPLAAPGFGPALRNALVADLPGTLAPAPAVWTTLATGQPADVHGITGPGYRSQSPAFWNLLARSGRRTAVVGWPATHPAVSDGPTFVTNTFADPTGSDAAHWPLPPGCVEPPALRRVLADRRVHPTQIPNDLLESVASSLSVEIAGILRDVIARTLTIRGAAMTLAGTGDAEVLAVHWDAPARFAHQLLARLADNSPSPTEWAAYRAATLGLQSFLAQVATDVASAAGSLTHLVLASSHGTTLPASVPHPTSDISRWVCAPGWIAVAGENVRPADRSFSASPLDLAPTMLDLMGASVPLALPGLSLTERAAGCRPEHLPQAEPSPASPARPVIWSPPASVPQSTAAFRVRAAREDEWELIHRLLGSPDWEAGHVRSAFVAEGFRGQRLGAAVLTCLSWTGTIPGVPIRLGVLPSANRRLTGQALIDASRREAAAWGMPALYAHDPVEPGTPDAELWNDLGFAVCESIARYEAPCAALRDGMSALVKSLRDRGRIPDDVRVVSVAEVPAESVACLYHQTLSKREALTELTRRIRGEGSRAIDAGASAALVVEGKLVGAALVRSETSDTGYVEAFMLDAECRGTWATPLLRYESANRGLMAGYETMRFDAGSEHLDTRKLATRLGATCIKVEDRYWTR